jgi:hypothetical protein
VVQEKCGFFTFSFFKQQHKVGWNNI